MIYYPGRNHPRVRGEPQEPRATHSIRCALSGAPRRWLTAMRPIDEWSPDLLRRVALGVGLRREDGITRDEFCRRWKHLRGVHQEVLLRRFSSSEPVPRQIVARELGWKPAL